FSSNDPFWDKELLLPRFIHLAYIAYTLLPSIEDICSGRLPALYKDRVRDVFKQAIAYYAKEESDMFYNSGSGLSKSAEYLERMNDED
ncbi:MAG: hypothetical protein MJ150_04815, partial [Clostridia bacterium]|nr:hypothetical protein [Clostridia bacterium]